jgi:indole-3-glycerol phosphate synthase
MKTALDEIIEYKHDEVAALKAKFQEAHFLNIIGDLPPPRGFKVRLDEVSETGDNALICEIKRKSPSAGDILIGADPLSVARDYERGGAACLSILTDMPSFGGTIADLEAVRGTVQIPILRKDFIIDPIQILESRAVGADCILLILSALDDSLATELQSTARAAGLDILVEVHDEDELERAMNLHADLIGINNRNLKVMKTDLGTSERLAPSAASHAMVSESGVRTPGDISRLRRSGFTRFLIGESLMKETNREQAARLLVKTTTS